MGELQKSFDRVKMFFAGILPSKEYPFSRRDLLLIEDAVIKQIPGTPTITIDGEFEHHDCKFCDDGYCGYKGITIENYCQNCGQRWTRWEDENE